ncbi:MAG: hydrolase [Clostridia bacterium]|nr:hydrolase [Clostridia bacterium]
MKKQEFIKIYSENIKREGADKLLNYLTSDSCDFFTAPASTRFHSAYRGGLLDHSLNVYHCLKDYLSRPRVKEIYGLDISEETVAIVSLLHDLCKINCYKPSTRNVKDSSGVWHTVPTYSFEDELPYGHGEKSVYIISGYMRLTREEAFAIRYHMGFSGNEDKLSVGNAFDKFPLAFALSTADMEATYFMEEEPEAIK